MDKNIRLLAETFGVFLAMSLLAAGLSRWPDEAWAKRLPHAALLLFQGLWFYRLYIVGHEASHRKLFPQSRRANDFWGALALLPLMVPLNVFRKIHMFHHGHNRRDDHTSALDTFVCQSPPGPLRRAWLHAVWYASVFLGGFFLHSLVSVLLFLFVPPRLARRISPAFEGWTWADQGRAVLLFALGLGFHLLVAWALGGRLYWHLLGLPFLSFAWVLSLLVYIFHYQTTVGPKVRFNVRSVRRVPFFSWLLMNFNEHATHHQFPHIPWHELPAKAAPLPPDYARQNQDTWDFFRAIANQLKGPRIVVAHDELAHPPRPER